MSETQRSIRKPPRPTSGLSIDAEMLISRLETMQPGEVMSYMELSALIGESVTGKRRWALYTARRILLRTKRMVFEAVATVGIKRVDGKDLVDVVQSGVRRGRRHFGRVRKKALACTEEAYRALSDEDRTALDAARTVAAVVSELSSRHALNRIATEVNGKSALPVRETLSLFTRRNGK